MEALPLLFGIEGPSLTPLERELFSRFQPAGYILFSRNIESLDACRALCEDLLSISQLPHPPLIAIDQEGGRVVRTQALGLKLPSAKALAIKGDERIIQDAAQICAQTLLMLGINTNFAPVLDAESPHKNALQDRCWGAQAQDIITLAGLWNQCLESHGIKGCAKHYPGMGEAHCDPHFDLPTLSGEKAQLDKNASQPFIELRSQLSSMMIAHLHLPDIDADMPASLSPILIAQHLRKTLAYEGLIFTDDLCMGAITQKFSLEQATCLALQAGCDAPLLCHNITPHVTAIAHAVLQLPADLLLAARNRIAHFAEAFRPLPPLDKKSWGDALQRSEQLCELCPEPQKNCTQGYHSPVQSY